MLFWGYQCRTVSCDKWRGMLEAKAKKKAVYQFVNFEDHIMKLVGITANFLVE